MTEFKNINSDRLLDLLLTLSGKSNNWQAWIELAEEILSMLPARISDTSNELFYTGMIIGNNQLLYIITL